MAHRILSLVPSATDWVCDLGLADHLVGVTHECELPEGVEAPAVVRPAVPPDPASPATVDAAVTAAAEQRRPLYDVDLELVAELGPTVALTQELCDVCAVSSSTVTRLREAMPAVAVVTLTGITLSGVLDDLRLVGAAVGAESAAAALRDRLGRRLAAVEDAVAGRPPVPVGLVEWPDPVWLPGHWVPDQIAHAGGRCVAGVAGQPSRRGRWEDLADAGVLVVAPCGYRLDEAVAHAVPHVPASAAAVWAVDANRAFSRPSAGVVDGVEALAAIAHPEAAGPADPAVARPVRPASSMAGQGSGR